MWWYFARVTNPIQLENDRCAGDLRMDRAEALRLCATHAKILHEAMAMRALRGH